MALPGRQKEIYVQPEQEPISPEREITVEPMPEPAPERKPEREPEKAPEREPEKVPA